VAVLDRFRLDGQVVLLTGAGRGLGRAMALAFADAGATVAGAARTAAQLEETAELVREHGGRASVLPTDVTDADSVAAMVQATLDQFGRVDVLVNNAGGGAEGDGEPLEQLTDEQWRRGIDLNLTSQMLCARTVLPHMRARGSGVIINVASGFGLRGGRHNWMYVSSKAGVVNFTRSLAVSYGPDGVRTNCIAPGIFPHTEQALERWRGGKYIPVGRVGLAWEMGPLAVWLASDGSAALNGETIAQDGGGLSAIGPTGWAPVVRLEEPD
jgi:NAD(P)-dependent dehydrogenase (short-subunit alcohol dehydrogenase family)